MPLWNATVYGLFTVIESYVSTISILIPGYYPLKLLFTLWLMHPKYRGALTIYKNIVGPYFRKNQAQIDALIEQAQNHTLEFLESLRKLALRQLRDAKDKYAPNNAVLDNLLGPSHNSNNNSNNNNGGGSSGSHSDINGGAVVEKMVADAAAVLHDASSK